METVMCEKDIKTLKCTHDGCKAKYNKQSKLDIHLKKHTTERPFQCDVCNKTFTNNSHLRKHKKNKHDNNIKPIRCTYEGCDTVLSNNYSYKRHLKNHHKSKEFSYTCEVCKLEFTKKSQLNAHMSEHTGTSSFKCDLCGLIFDSKTQYRKHRRQEKEIKKYKCTFEGCNSKFRRPSKLEVHIRKHTGERPFKCDECDKTYTNESHRRRHKNTVHLKRNVEPIRCPYVSCYKYLANKFSYKKHINRYHINNKEFPYNCETCNQGFYKKSQLNSHAYEHTGTTPYKCDSCKKIFVNVTDYKKHKSNHKTYECLCKEIFDRWTKLLEHKKTCDKCIKVFKCNDCNKIFKNNKNLTFHLKNHKTDNKIFKCSEEGCTRAYKYERNLRVHVRYYHLKEEKKKIKCTFPGCNKEVVQFKQHLKFHEKPKDLKKIRAVRKDKGKIKRSTALQLAGLTTNYDVEKKIIKGERVAIEFNGEVIETKEFDDTDSETEESDISVEYDDYSESEESNTDVTLKSVPDNVKTLENRESNVSGNSNEDRNVIQKQNLLIVTDDSKESDNLIQQGKRSNSEDSSIHTKNNKVLQIDKNSKNITTKTFSIKSRVRAKMIFENSEKINEKQEIGNRKNSGTDKTFDETLEGMKNDGNENKFDSIFNYMLEKIQHDTDECDNISSNNFLNTSNLQGCSKEVDKNDLKKILLTRVCNI